MADPKALNSTQITLPRSVALVVTGKAKDTSTIAALSPSKPEIFEDETYLVFTGGSEAEVVAEGKAKGSYEQEPPAPVVAKRFTVQTTTRVSAQLQWADEDAQLKIISAIQEDQAAALGRVLDYVVYHAVQPKTGGVLSGFDKLSEKAKQVYLGAELKSATDTQLIEAIDNLAEEVSDLYDVNGIALSKLLTARLRRIRVKNTMARMYPEIPLNLKPGVIEGITAATSGTVNGRLATADTNVLAFCGDFSMIKWGVVRDIRSEIIPFGDPDGQGDLKRYNQVAYRTEATYGYAVLDPNAISVLKGGAAPAGE